MGEVTLDLLWGCWLVAHSLYLMWLKRQNKLDEKDKRGMVQEQCTQVIKHRLLQDTVDVMNSRLHKLENAEREKK